MLNNIKKSLTYSISAVAIGLLTQSTAIAGHGDGDQKGAVGTVSCGGNYFIRKGGTEVNTANYILRNYADSGVINIDRIRVYDAHGTGLFDSNISGIPVFRNNVLSASDTGLDPRQTAHLKLEAMIPPQDTLTRPIQTVINWSSEKKILTLEASLVRVNADRDADTGKMGRQRGRHLYECRTTSLKKNSKHSKHKRDHH